MNHLSRMRDILCLQSVLLHCLRSWTRGQSGLQQPIDVIGTAAGITLAVATGRRASIEAWIAFSGSRAGGYIFIVTVVITV